MQNDIAVEEFTSDLVKRLARRLEKQADAYLKQSAHMGLHEWQLLVHIYEFNNQKLNEISDELSVNLADLIVSFDALEKLGYAYLNRDDLTVRPTEEGRAAYLTVLPLMKARQNLLLSQFSFSERQTLQRLLHKLFHQVSAMLEEQQDEPAEST